MMVFSPAKINLFLEILSKQNNGFHRINILMCICNIGDKIEVSKSSNYELKISGKFKDQLIGKKNIGIQFNKRIPNQNFLKITRRFLKIYIKKNGVNYTNLMSTL